MLSRGVTLVRPSAPFRFHRAQYMPDWYSAADKTYYEVLASPGPTNRIPLILDLMEIFHPTVRLVCVKPEGQEFSPHNDRTQRRYAAVSSWPFGDDLLRRMSESRMRWSDVADRVGVDHTYLSRILHGKRAMPESVRHRLQAFASGAA